MAVVLLALGVPLGIDLASVRTQRVFLDRLNDANRFVQVAQQQGDRSVLAEKLARYEEVYGIVVAVLDHSGRVRAASRPGLEPQSLTRAGPAARRGRAERPPRRAAARVWPWTGPRSWSRSR